MAVCACAALFLVAYANTAAAELAVGREYAYPGESVGISFVLDSNPGIAGLRIEIEYDGSRLRVDNTGAMRQGPALNRLSFVGMGNAAQNPLPALWFGTSNDTSTGVILELEFTVLENAPVGDAFVRAIIPQGEAIDLDEVPVQINITQGGINVVRGYADAEDAADADEDGRAGEIDEGEAEAAPVTPAAPPAPSATVIPAAPVTPEKNATPAAPPNESGGGLIVDAAQPPVTRPPAAREDEIRNRLRAATVLDIAGFDDVAHGAWYHAAVTFAAERGLFQGVGHNLFAPAGTMTRAMFITVLSRIDGVPSNSAYYNTSTFADVSIAAWYGSAISWAAQRGIICDDFLSGNVPGWFGPGDFITREEMALILANYLAFRDFSLNRAEVAAFDDIAEASVWARDAIHLMRAYSIIHGVGNNLYNPASMATRAEVSQIFKNLVSIIISG